MFSMKTKLKVFGAIVCILSILSTGVSVYAAGYDIIMDPKINYIDGSVDGWSMETGEYTLDTYFYPTPFCKGYSVVHNNVLPMPGWEVTYYDKSSYVVDMYGNKLNLGNYDSFGVYPFNFGENLSEEDWVKEFGGSPWREYKNPNFDPYTGVDSLGYITVSKGGKGGLIDAQGNIIIPCEYDDLYDGAYELYGIDYSSDLELKPYEGKYFAAYYDPYYYSEYDHNYYNGLAVVAQSQDENAKVGIVDENDNIIVPFIYDMITPCYDKVCWALKDGKWGVIIVDNQTVTVKIDNENVAFDQIPLIINGRTLAPLRAIFEKLGATVEWNGETRTITSTKGDTVITMTIDKNEMYKNGEMIWLDVAPQIVGERTLVPVRAIAEAFNCNVTWDGANHTVNIAK